MARPILVWDPGIVSSLAALRCQELDRMLRTGIVLMSLLTTALVATPLAAAGPTDQHCTGGLVGCTTGYLPYAAKRWAEDPSFEYAGFVLDKYVNGVECALFGC
jgi:hypothetical protein